MTDVQKMTVQKSNKVVCVDCIAEGVTAVRPIVTSGKLAKYSGPRKPRCTTHARARHKAAQIASHARTTEKTYGITGEQYWALYEAQGGRCAICQWATGKTKRLAVDHDHDTGFVNGLLCGPCNQMRGRLGNESFVRAIQYNLDPPARAIIGDVKPRELIFDEDISVENLPGNVTGLST